MRHRFKGRNLSRTWSHRRALMANLLSSLITYGRIRTTEAKGKELRILADKVVTLAKEGSLHSRRVAQWYVPQKAPLARLFSELGPRFHGRSGGYTRSFHTARRIGDSAHMVLIEYLGEDLTQRKTQSSKLPAAKGKRKKSVTKASHVDSKNTGDVSDQKEEILEQRFHAEEKHAVEHEAAKPKRSFFKRSPQGLGKIGRRKKGEL